MIHAHPLWSQLQTPINTLGTYPSRLYCMMPRVESRCNTPYAVSGLQTHFITPTIRIVHLRFMLILSSIRRHLLSSQPPISAGKVGIKSSNTVQ